MAFRVPSMGLGSRGSEHLGREHLLLGKPALCSKEYWMRDENCRSCYQCDKAFTLINRRHHCRVCGFIFCWRCSGKTLDGESFGQSGTVRVCDYCYDFCGRAQAEPLPGASPLNNSSPAALMTGGGDTSPRGPSTPGSPRNPPVQRARSGQNLKEEKKPGFPAWYTHTPLGASSSHLPQLPDAGVWESEEGLDETPLAETEKLLSHTLEELPMTQTQTPGMAELGLDEEDIADVNEEKARIDARRRALMAMLAGDVAAAAAATEGTTAGTPLAAETPATPVEAPPPEPAMDATPADAPLGTSPRPPRILERQPSTNVRTPPEGPAPAEVPEGTPSPRSVGGFPAPPVDEEMPVPARIATPPPAVDPLHSIREKLARFRLPMAKDMTATPPAEDDSDPYSRHLTALVRQCLEARGADVAFVDTIVALARRAAETVRPDVAQGDSMDINDYVKVFAVGGGEMGESCYHQGVVCVKNVAHRKMRTRVDGPRILLLRNALQYQRVENKFSSFDALLAQEKEFLRIRVAQIVAMRPDVVLVEKAVSRLAQEELHAANIALGLNMGHDLMERIARLTEGEILPNIDNIHVRVPRLGRCGSFRVSSLLDQHRQRQTFMYFDGCNARLGATIVLRGPVPETANTDIYLRALTASCEFAIFAAYHLHLERRLAAEQRIRAPPFLLPEAGPILSVSPGVAFPAPMAAAPGRRARTTDAVPVQDASPFLHQSLVVSFASLSTVTHTICVPPDIKTFHYYQNTDTTLGNYLRLCFDPLSCPQARCGRDMCSHVISYVHNEGRVSVTVEHAPTELRAPSDRFVLWTACRVCGRFSAPSLMSFETCSISLGKYLELLFYDSGAQVGEGECAHPFRDHTRCFLSDSKILYIRYEPISLLETVLPPDALPFDDALRTSLRVQDLQRTTAHANRVYDCLLKKLLDIKCASIDNPPSNMQHLLESHYSERERFFEKLATAEKEVAERDSNNNLKRTLYVNCLTWSTSILALDGGASSKTEQRRSLPVRSRPGTGDWSEIEALDVVSVMDAFPTKEYVHLLLPSGPDVCINIIEDEPASVIAYCLSSAEYARQIDEVLREDGFPPRTEELTDAVREATLRAEERRHFVYEFSNQGASFSCKAYYPLQFHALRREYLKGDERLIESLSRTQRWQTSGGKSGSWFFQSRDGRFALKSITSVELLGFLESAPAYFEYMANAFYHQMPTLLAKTLGVYRVAVSREGQRQLKQDFVVMENLFYQRDIAQAFDLKGSERSRYIKKENVASKSVLLDENFLEYITDTPLYMRQYSKAVLSKAIRNDTLFLSKIQVMDYSLLVGIDSHHNHLVVGIIDYMRKYTWDKKLETWVKSYGIMGGGQKKPTIITPELYMKRFRAAMMRYFVLVPDKHIVPPS